MAGHAVRATSLCTQAQTVHRKHVISFIDYYDGSARIPLFLITPSLLVLHPSAKPSAVKLSHNYPQSQRPKIQINPAAIHTNAIY